MIRVLLIWLLLGSPALAQSIRVRSGEHETFSRLVFDLPPGTGWSVETTGDVIKLMPGNAALRFDFTDVFNLIPRTRIRSIERETTSGDILIRTTGDVHARSFETESGAAVIDVNTGPETVVATLSKAAPQTPLPPVLPSASISVQQLNEKLPIYWRRKMERAIAEEPPEPHPPEPSEPSEPSATLSKTPDVQQAEQDLLHQISRAAAQGLVRIDTRQGIDPFGPELMAQPGTDESPSAEYSPQIAVQSHTVIDRDNAVSDVTPEVSEDGVRCYTDDELDLAAWLGEKPITSEIGAARAALVGEFDRPSQADVEHLSKLYIALGFGTEARALLNTMSAEPEANVALFELAALVENRAVSFNSAIRSMTGCNSSAALWAVLATPEEGVKKARINEEAIVRAFSALPPHMRMWLGSELTKRLISADATRTAETVRAAIARSPDADGPSLRLVDAQLSLAVNDMNAAEPELQELVAQDGDETAQALLLYALAKIEHGEEIDANTIETLEALAFEHASTPLGAKLRRVHVLSLGATAQFNEAFATLSRWPLDQETGLRRNTEHELYQRLVAVADSGQFLTHVFSRANQDDQADLDTNTRFLLAQRLVEEGFSNAARRQLNDDIMQETRGRILLAQMSLNDNDAPAAIAHLVGLDEESANALRAEALQQITGAKDAQASDLAKLSTQDAFDTTKPDQGDMVQSPSDTVEALLPGLANARGLLEKSAFEREALQALLNQTADLKNSP